MPQSYELYGGDVVLTFDEDKHTYKINGSLVKDSISGCLKVIAKPALVGWAASAAVDHIVARMYPGMMLDEIIIKDLAKGAKVAYRQKTEDAADLGTLGHKWVEDYLKAQAENRPTPGLPINPQLRNIAETFLQFMRDNDVQVIAAEQKVYSRKLNIAGTFDCLAKFNGKLAILDWKTGSGIYPEYFLQMGGYDVCYTEEINPEPECLHGPDTACDCWDDYATSGNPVCHVIVNCSKTGELKVAITDKVQRNREGFKQALALSRTLTDVQQELKDGR
jgi:hypothetical protein